MRKSYVLAGFAIVLGVAVGLKSASTGSRTGVWDAAGLMAEARAGASAARLPDGRVLVTGGTGDNGALATAELFDGARSFSRVASMMHPRSQHVSVVLPDGRVLVAGGRTQGDAVFGSAELYDPDANTWTGAGVMSVSRVGHTATVLRDGRILIAGGQSGDVTHTSLEVFDPGSGRFESFPGQLSSPRTRHAAALLPDGRILIAGGYSGSETLRTTEIVDLRSQTVLRGPDLLSPREAFTATDLLDGRVLIAGGTNGSVDLASAELLDPTAMKLTSTGVMTTARRGHLAFRLPSNNRVLLVGGDPAGNSTELFTPWRGAFQATGELQEARSDAAGAPVGFDGELVVAGGRNRALRLDSSRLYRFPTITTDREDYMAGATVAITGSGWRPGERVTLLVQAVPKTREDRTLVAQADAAGRIANSDLQQDAGGASNRYFVTAFGASAEGQAVFANASANLDQCANGTLSSPTGCTTSGEWVNGNVNGSKAHYFEGDSVPYRMLFSSLTLASHTVTIEWDTTQQGKHALDYITTFNRTVTTANPCAGVSPSPCGTSTTFAIPADPNVTGAGVTPIAGNFTLYGGAITAASAYTLSGTFSGNSSTRITVTFTANVANPILAWGGHIATRLDWGATSSAVAISGSPYHTRLIALDGSGGNQDRSLSSDAVIFPAIIQIIKDAVPDSSSQSFSFTATPAPPLSNFSLTDTGGTATDCAVSGSGTFGNTQCFTNITNFQKYTITEGATGNWTLDSITCSVTSPNGGDKTIGTSGVDITVKEGENWSCTFKNKINTHSVTLIKHLSPTTDGGLFNLTAAGTTATDQGHNGQAQNTTVAVGTSVSVSEAAGTNTNLSNYTSSLSCVGVSASGTTSAAFTMPDNDVTCTVTNTRKTRTVKLTKTVLPAGDGGTFSLTAGTVTATKGDGQSVQDTVAVGSSVSVSEVANANYSAVLSCDNGASGSTSASFTMPDADVNCTVTNTRKTHTVKLTKVVLPAGDGGTFSLTAGTVTATKGDGQLVQDTVAVGSSVSVSEIGNPNYDAVLSCDNGASGSTSASFTMPDADVNCTVTNTRKTHTVKLTKVVLPAGDGGTFSLTAGTVTATKGDGQSVQDTAAVGTSVTVSEVANANYNAALSCDNGASGTNSASFTMPDADVNCTVTNTRKNATLTVNKVCVPYDPSQPLVDPGQFDLTFSGGATAINAATLGCGSLGSPASTGKITVGISGTPYHVAESYHLGTLGTNYQAPIFGGDCNASGNVTVSQEGHDYTCWIMNINLACTPPDNFPGPGAGLSVQPTQRFLPPRPTPPFRPSPPARRR